GSCGRTVLTESDSRPLNWPSREPAAGLPGWPGSRPSPRPRPVWGRHPRWLRGVAPATRIGERTNPRASGAGYRRREVPFLLRAPWASPPDTFTRYFTMASLTP